MKHLNLAFAGVVAGSLALSAQAGVSTWWSEDFSDYSLDINAMTNDFTKGTWTMAEGDGSALVASYSNQVECLGGLSAAPENVLALSTEGNELRFAPTNATAVSGVTVVDADVFFVGSESAPSFTDTDIQFAMYLQVPEDGGDNAVMVYVRDEVNDEATWVELSGTSTILDKTWHHVQVKIDYNAAPRRTVKVIIDDSEVTPQSGLKIASATPTPIGLSSVSFRGTGAVDNFAGGWETVDPLPLHTFTASAYVDGVLDQTVEIAAAEDIQAGTDASFEVARTVGTKTIAKIVVKGFESASDTEYTVTDDGTDFTVTPSGLDVDATDPSVVFINVPTDDAATTGAAQTYPALEVWYATPAAELTGLSKYLGSQVQGEGTAASPWQIPDLATLKALQAAVAAKDADCIDAYYVQTADIALDAAWPGIGVQNGKDIVTQAAYDAGAFQGTYDGGNHTISNFQMVDGLDYCGLFNSVKGATIKNLKVSYKDGNFAKDMAAANDACGATFVGVAKASTLQNLTSLAGTVSCTKGFGGIVGYLMAGSTVDSCTNNVNLTSTKSNKAGGIAMITQNGTGTAVIRNCQNNGTTTGNPTQKGGIVGYVGVATTIENCEDTAGSDPSFLHHQTGTLTLSGVNKAPAGVKSYTKNATNIDGLLFATVNGNVATFVHNADLALGNTYKVMGPGAAYEFATTGSITFDEALVTPTVTAPGMVLSSSTSNNVTTYTATAAAARIGTTNYATFAEALAAAQAGNTITLLANVALTSTVTVNKNLTIDLNGNNVTATDCRAFHVTAGAFALTGEGTVSTVVTQGTQMASSGSVIRVGSDTAATSFTLGEDVTVSSDYCYGVTYFGTQPQTVVLNGTVAVTGAQAAISGNGLARNAAVTLTVGETAVISATQDYAIYNPQTGTTTINGTVTGPGGVEVKAGTVTVGSTAKITATGTPSYSQSNQNGTSTSGYAIAAVGNSAYQQPAAAVVEEGAKVNGTVIVLEENNSTTYGSITSDAELTAPTGYLWVAGEEAGTVELVKAFTVTFTTERGTAPATQTVANGALATEPTAPKATGWTFDGWTLAGAAYSFSTPVTADITLVAAWTENAQPVEPPKVDPGTGVAAYNTTYGTAVAPIEVTSSAFKVNFVATVPGTYVLMAATTVDGNYAETEVTQEVTAAQIGTEDALVTLEDTNTTAPAKFYKIGWEE